MGLNFFSINYRHLHVNGILNVTFISHLDRFPAEKPRYWECGTFHSFSKVSFSLSEKRAFVFICVLRLIRSDIGRLFCCISYASYPIAGRTRERKRTGQKVQGLIWMTDFLFLVCY